MADTFTPHYNLTKPQVGGDPDTWGDLLNANFDAIDTGMFNAQTTANAAMPKTGGAFTGNLSVAVATSLGTTLGASNVPLDLNQLATANVDHLRFLHLRVAAGSDWTGAVYQIGRVVDSTAQGYIQFGEAVSGSGIAFGTAGVINASFNSSGNWTFANLITANGGISSTGNFTCGTLTASGTVIGGGGNLQAGATAGNNTTLNFSGVMSTNRTLAPGTSYAQSLLTLTGSFGGGLVLNDPSGGSNWGMYSASGTLIFGNNGGSGGLASKSTLSTGGIWTAVDFSATSDMRLKDNVKRLRRGLHELKKMLPREYDKFENFEKVGPHKEEVGFIAQEVEKVLPEAVSEHDGVKSVSYGQIIALLASAILELDHRLSLEGM